MDTLDWVAILGALAWLPHLFRYGYELLSKPKVKILTNPAPELGFTTYGPILNLRMAFIVERKDIVISGIKIYVKHESGSEQEFVWQGMVQTLGRLNNQQLGNMPFEKESNVLALKAKTSEVDERFVRFQDSAFIEGKREIEDRISNRLMYLRRQKGELNTGAFLKSDEMTDLCTYVKRSFSWKEGSYLIRFEIESPQAFDISNNVYSFNLNSVDIEQLEKNSELIDLDYRYQAIPRKEGEPEVVWAWRYPRLQGAET